MDEDQLIAESYDLERECDLLRESSRGFRQGGVAPGFMRHVNVILRNENAMIEQRERAFRSANQRVREMNYVGMAATMRAIDDDLEELQASGYSVGGRRGDESN